MNLDKAKKRIAKKVKIGFKGYPQISIAYFGASKDLADEVVISFVAQEGQAAMEERFASKSDARSDEVIQSAIVKIIERSEAKTVLSCEEIELKS